MGRDPLADRHAGRARPPRYDAPAHRPEVARLVESGSQPAVNTALRRLSEEGVVHAVEAGNAYLYTLNRDHLAAPALELLADVRAELERRLDDEIADWEIAPAHVSIFGSAARGDGDMSSDIDLFVVRPRQVSAEEPVGRAARPSLRARARLDRQPSRTVRGLGGRHPPAATRAPSVVDELTGDAITIAGPDPSDLFRARR